MKNVAYTIREAVLDLRNNMTLVLLSNNVNLKSDDDLGWNDFLKSPIWEANFIIELQIRNYLQR